MKTNVIKIRDMFVKDFNDKYGDIDIVNDVTDDYSFAFCGGVELTEAGAEHFKDILDDEITMYGTDYIVGCVLIDKYGDNWEEHWNKIDNLFAAAAGYVSESEYNKYFKEVE